MRSALVLILACAGSGLWAQAQPDLTITRIDTTLLTINDSQGFIDGIVVARVKNIGTAAPMQIGAVPAVQVRMWEDRNSNGVEDTGDQFLGAGVYNDPNMPLRPGDSREVRVATDLGNGYYPKLALLSSPRKPILVRVQTGLADSNVLNNLWNLLDPSLNAPKTAVDLELSLSIDVSGSVDATEFALQRDGYAQAFRSAPVIQAIQAGRGIAVNLICWAESSAEVIPWTLITDAATANAFAARIQALVRPFEGNTHIVTAIERSYLSILGNDYDGRRKVIDISGDGDDNSQGNLSFAREEALRAVSAVNGLPIGDTSLPDYYQRSVIGGRDAFAIPATDFVAFAASIELKIRTEISGSQSATLVDALVSRFKDASVDLLWPPVPGATGYNIYRRTQSTQPQLIKGNHQSPTASFTDLALTNGTPYFYSVRWLDSSGRESATGTEASATPTSRTVRGNTPPTITSVPLTQGAAGVAYAYRVIASDPDAADVLTYSLTTQPTGMTIAPSTGQISWTPASTQGGYSTVAVRVRDINGNFATQTFQLFVTASITSKHPPVFVSSPVRTARFNQLYRYQPSVIDIDTGDTKTFLTEAFNVGLPTGATLDAATGLIQWTPTSPCSQGAELLPQYIDMGFLVRDSAGLTAYQRFNVVVSCNTAPVIISTPITTGSPATLYDYPVMATDQNTGDILTYSLTTAPTGMTINASSGRIQWTPAAGQLGPQNVVVRVADSGGLAATQSFIVTIVAIDSTPPTVSILAPTTGTDLTTDATITGTASDANLQSWTLEFQVTGGTNWIPLATGTTSVVNAPLGVLRAGILANNPYSVRLRARDNFQESVAVVDVNVNTGELKLGSFSVTFEDLRVPALGLPIAIQRTYSSLNPESGDFGTGWSLGFSNLLLRKAANFDVFVTLPDNRRVKFRHSPTPLGFGVYTNRYVGDAGVFDTLTNLDCPNLFGSPGNWLCDLSTGYNPQNYKLTTKSGFSYFVNAQGAISRIEDRSANFVTIASTGITSSDGRVVRIERDSQSRITRIFEQVPVAGSPTTPAEVRYTYGTNGSIADVTHQGGRQEHFFYTNSQFPTFLTAYDNAGGPQLFRNVFNAQGRLVGQCDPNGNITTLDGCVKLNPNDAARTETIFNQRGFKTDLVLDSRGNVLNERRYTDATNFLETIRTYDANNNLLTERDPAGNQKSFSYDSRSNKLTDTDTGARTTTYTFNSCDKVATERDPAGNTTTYTYDAVCNLRFVADALGNNTEYRYNARGQRTHFIDPNGNAWVWVYDGGGFLTGLTDPFGKATMFTFNGSGDLLSRTDRLGRRIDFQYDAEHRLTRETWNSGPQRALQYGYHASGLLGFASDPDTTINSINYDANQRLRSADHFVQGLTLPQTSYGYDANGNVGQFTVAMSPQSFASFYAYDGLDRVTKITQAGGPADIRKRVDLIYDTASILRELRRFSNEAGTQGVANTLFEYDCGGCAGRLTAIRHRKASDNSVIHDLTFSRDSLGNILGSTDAEGTHTYTYDAIRRLKTVSNSNTGLQPNESYTYDAIGNRLTSHLSNTHAYTRNRLSQDQQFNYVYDDEGNLIKKTSRTDGSFSDYTYDFRNRLTLIVQKSSGGVETGRADYVYDALNRRVKTVEAGQTAYFMYDGLNPAYKFRADGSMISGRLYSRALDGILADEVPGGQTRWFLTDQVGTVRDLVANSGVALNHYNYDSFGRLLSQSNPAVMNEILFTGREFDTASGLGYFRARYYHPGLARFGQEDPFSPMAYAYVDNQPLTATDPLGFFGLSGLTVSMRAAQGLTPIGALLNASLSRLAITQLLSQRSAAVALYFWEGYFVCRYTSSASVGGCLAFATTTAVGFDPGLRLGPIWKSILIILGGVSTQF